MQNLQPGLKSLVTFPPFLTKCSSSTKLHEDAIHSPAIGVYVFFPKGHGLVLVDADFGCVIMPQTLWRLVKMSSPLPSRSFSTYQAATISLFFCDGSVIFISDFLSTSA